MSKYARIAKKWYDKGKWSEEKLRVLVEAEAITAEEFFEITGKEY